MQSSKKPRIFITPRFFIAVAVGLATILIAFHILGKYHFGSGVVDAKNIAEQLVQERKDVNECWNIISFLPTYPPMASIRARCVYHFAQIARDPAACELIMPSKYGEDCISNVVWSNTASPLWSAPCTVDPEHLSCYIDIPFNPHKDHQDKEANASFPYSSCEKITDQSIRELCFYGAGLYGEAKTLRQRNPCDQIVSNQELHEVCWYSASFTLKDPSLCSRIQNPIRSSACEVRIASWIKYPELR